MKKTLTICLLIVICQLLAATGVKEHKALQKAQSLMGATTPMELISQAPGETPAYYIFNAVRDQKGFVIVAGDDGNNDILGYADNGEYDPKDVPPALLFWLQCYEEQIEHIRNGLAETFRAPEQHAAITPLIRTLWSQRGPYNLQNPPSTQVTGLTSFPCTGCTATAMAQIMKYWAADFQTEAIPAYSYTCTYKNKDYTVNVDGLEPTTFDYSIIRDSYASNATDASAQEVAKLMAYCGRAAKMKYKESSSSATCTGTVFSTYFGYNPNCTDEYANNYTAAEWDAMVYGELKSGRPVLMAGHKQSGGGHAFVCDGYKDGLYHFNWGWGGSYNGYYKLTEANPKGGGDGAGQGADGYSFTQRIAYHLQPEAMEAEEPLMTVSLLNTNNVTYTRDNSSSNFTVPVTFSAYNKTGAKHLFYTGVGAYQDGDLVASKQYTYATLSNNTGYSNRSVNLAFGKNVTEGTYLIKAICKDDNAKPWQADKVSNIYYLKATINDNTLTIRQPQVDMLVNSVTLEGYQKQGLKVGVIAHITNNGSSMRSAVYLFVDDILETGTGVHIDEGDSDEVTLYFTPSEAKVYDLRICADDAGTQTLWSGTVDITERQEPNLSVTGYQVANATGKNITGTTFKATCNIKNLNSVSYDDIVIFKLCKKATIDATSGSIMETKSCAVSIPALSTKTVEIAFDHLEVGGFYFINVYVYQPSTKTELRLRSIGTYTILEDPSGIATITTDPITPATTVYNLSGQRMGTAGDKLPKGTYVTRGKKFVVK